MEENKKCNNCQQSYTLDNYYLIKNQKTGEKYPNTVCKSCVRSKSKKYKDKYREKHKAEFKEKRKTDFEFGEKLRKQKRENSRKNYKSIMLQRARERAKKKGLEFNLEIEDIFIPELCPLLKIPFILGKSKDYLYTPSIDRIDSTKGYIKGNINVISMLANSMKNCATKEQLITFSNNIEEYLRYSPSYKEEELIELEDKEPLG